MLNGAVRVEQPRSYCAHVLAKRIRDKLRAPILRKHDGVIVEKDQYLSAGPVRRSIIDCRPVEGASEGNQSYLREIGEARKKLLRLRFNAVVVRDEDLAGARIVVERFQDAQQAGAEQIHPVRS